MDVEVVWRGSVVGRLCGVTIDQPHCYGRWVPAGDPAFEAAFETARAGLAAGQAVIWDAAFRTPGRDDARPATLVVTSGRAAPRFRLGGSGGSTS